MLDEALLELCYEYAHDKTSSPTSLLLCTVASGFSDPNRPTSATCCIAVDII